MIMMALCLYQYLMVAGPLDSSISVLQSCVFIVLAWCLAVALSIAPIFDLGRYEFSSSIFDCVFPNKTGYFQRTVYNGILMGILYILPIVFLGICYALILFYLRDPDTRTVKGCIIASVATSDGCLETGQARTAIAIVFIYLAFVVFRTPFFVFMVLSTWNIAGSNWLTALDQIAFWAIYCHAASDPFVYAFQHGEYMHTLSVIYKTMKERFFECFCCCFRAEKIEEGEKLSLPPQTRKRVSFEKIDEEE